MKHPNFDTNRQQWDEYKAFHVNHIRKRLVQFDTGEMVIANSNFPPDLRRTYDEFGISILTANDKAFPKVKMIDGTPVPAVWLTEGGARTLLIDHTTGKVTQLASMEKDTTVPVRFRKYHMHAYCPGYGAEFAAGPVRLRPPVKLSPEQKQHTNKLADQCRMWLAMTEEVDRDRMVIKTTNTSYRCRGALRGGDLMTVMTAQTMADMSLMHRCMLATYGFRLGRATISVPYLVVA